MIADRWYVAVIAGFGNVAFYGREEGGKVLARKITHIIFPPDGRIHFKKWQLMDLSASWLDENALDINSQAVIGMRAATEIASNDFERVWDNKPGIILANGSQDVKKAEADAKRFKAL